MRVHITCRWTWRRPQRSRSRPWPLRRRADRQIAHAPDRACGRSRMGCSRMGRSRMGRSSAELFTGCSRAAHGSLLDRIKPRACARARFRWTFSTRSCAAVVRAVGCLVGEPLLLWSLCPLVGTHSTSAARASSRPPPTLCTLRIEHAACPCNPCPHCSSLPLPASLDRRSSSSGPTPWS